MTRSTHSSKGGAVKRLSALTRSRDFVTTVADLAGLASVTAGAAYIYAPAAYIVAGAGVLFGSYRIAKAAQ